METLEWIVVTEEEAVNEIYTCFEQFMSTRGLIRTGESHENDNDEAENSDAIPLPFWRNELLFRDPRAESPGAIRLVFDGSLFSDGIVQFRERTRIVFKDTDYGVMWKVVPLTHFAGGDMFDGCFTENHDDIEDMMDLVDQSKQFGSFLDVVKKSRAYIHWTTFAMIQLCEVVWMRQPKIVRCNEKRVKMLHASAEKRSL